MHITDIFTAALADGTFFLWTINLVGTKWCKAACVPSGGARGSCWSRRKGAFHLHDRAVRRDHPRAEVGRRSRRSRRCSKAFDSTIIGANDEVVSRYMSGGHWEELDAAGRQQ